MERRIEVLGAAHLELVDDVALLEPRAQVFETMLDGWRSQQLSRNLTFSTIDAGARVVSRFRHDTEVWPWEWTPGNSKVAVPGSKLGMYRPDDENMRRWIMRLHQYSDPR